MKRFDLFSLLAPYYDRIFAGLDPARLRELLALPAGRLLDVGGGTGRVAALLAGDVAQIVIADPSKGMLGGSKTKSGLLPTRAHAERLPYRDGSFDRILIVDALHHFHDQRQAAPELLRVLAPGGRLVIEEMNYDRLPVKFVALGEKLALMGSRFYRAKDLGRLFEGTGRRVSVYGDHAINVWVVVDKEDLRVPPGEAKTGSANAT
jgi:demethylmenaquinone methyltransferase/2-methoxy-6-polyprenyl-1,4-benzoquinol methylase